MIVQVINVDDVTVLEAKNNPPISTNRHTPVAGETAFKRMQPEAG